MLERKLCPSCNQRPVAVNYVKEGVRHYRSLCDICNSLGHRARPKAPGWYVSGYRKKPNCERCNFKFKLPEQSSVFYTDGNLKNNNWNNLKTVCLNCQQEVYKSRLPWKRAAIVPDF